MAKLKGNSSEDKKIQDKNIKKEVKKDTKIIEKKETLEKSTEKKYQDSVEILPDVISSIASFEIEKIPGVDRQGSILQDIGEAIGNWTRQTKGITVEINEDKVIIDISINVNYGIRIPDVAFEIQTKVKKAVEQMTGLNVREVNVHIKGIKFKEEEIKELDITKIKVEKPNKNKSKNKKG